MPTTSRLDLLVQAAGYSNYAAYLNSSHWKGVRKRYKESGLSQRCDACGHDSYQLHHVTYERLGDELLSDLRPLCYKCHSREHGRSPSGFPLSIERLVAAAKAMPDPPALTRGERRPLPKNVLLLLKACMVLQQYAGENPFFLSNQDAGRVMGVGTEYGRLCLRRLCREGRLRLMERGSNAAGKASTYTVLESGQ